MTSARPPADVNPQPQPQPQPQPKGIWLKVVGRFRPYGWLLCMMAALVIFSVALSMVSPLLLRRVIDDALPRHNTRLLIVLCVAMIASGALGTGSAVTVNALTSWIGQRIVHGLRLDVYDRVQRMPLEFFAREPASEIQTRMASDIGGISDIISSTAPFALTAVVSLLAASLVMLILSWPLALFCLILSVGLTMLNRRFTSRRRALAVQRQERVSAMLRLVGEDLSLPGVILGRTLVRHTAQRSLFCVISQQVGDLTYRQRVAGSASRGVIGVTVSLLPPLTYLLAGTAVRGLSLGTVVVLVTLQMRVTGPIQQLLELNGQLQSSLAMFNRVFDYLDMRPAVTLTGDRPHSGRVALRARGVWHRYPAAERAALTGVDLDLPPGSATLVTGHTGSGKSTLSLILAGLLAPGGGTVEITSTPSGGWRPIGCEDLWRHVTLVAQETVMFNTSIRENLLFARPAATGSQLRDVIGAMQLETLVARLPRGLDTAVGEHGYQLSGGERQRLALARALLVPSGVLIADEATSAMDRDTAETVHTALRDRCHDRALVIVAHQIPLMEPADQVLILTDGCIAHRGTHVDLQRDCPAYQRLLTAPLASRSRKRKVFGDEESVPSPHQPRTEPARPAFQIASQPGRSQEPWHHTL